MYFYVVEIILIRVKCLGVGFGEFSWPVFEIGGA
jgi:hypothetical protein